MSVSEQRGHIKEPPLGGESGPELAEWEDEEASGPDVDWWGQMCEHCKRVNIFISN